MSSPRNTEPQANGALARVLRGRNPDWNADTLYAERTNVIQQAISKQPDIVVAAPRSQPVILETEFAPAPTVDQDAISRLGKRLQTTGEEIEGVLSVILPETFRTANLETIDKATFRYATHYLNSKGESTRWPGGQEWLEGNIDDLADAVEYLSLSERQLARGTEALERMVRNTAALLGEHAGENALAEIASDLHQESGEQTQRMAAAIFVSAFVFHAAIEEQRDIPPVPLVGNINKGLLLGRWNSILEINYWPIFSIARDLLEKLSIKSVPSVMNRIAASISDLTQLGATTYHDLTGRMFQTLISDRKFLATFYTLPESACLLAELAVERLDVDWSDSASIKGLRIADFACGTGALLSAAQRSVYRRYRRAGGDDKDLHRALMERGLTGLDIMPAATHLTCSMLSSAHPSLAYGESQIHTMPYGIDGGRTHIGALDLLDSEHSLSLFATGESLVGTGADHSSLHSVSVKDKSCDLVIMNPPFTRPVGHDGAHVGVPVPAFAGFSTTESEQRAMSMMLKKCKPEFGHGRAGLASNFMDLGHRKLKDNGVLALIIPFSFVRGKAWQNARQLLGEHYSEIHVTSIAATGSTKRAFSADTGMAECLVVATKKGEGSFIAGYSNLPARPTTVIESAVVAKNARTEMVKDDILNGGAAGIRSKSVIRSVHDLENSSLSLPRIANAARLPIVPLSTVARRGLYHLDINGTPTDLHKVGPPQGPFVKRSIHSGEIPTYPMLWAHSAVRERKFVVKFDSCGDPRPGDEERAERRWRHGASRLHCNEDFQLNSQSLAMCLTPDKGLGGRAWKSIIPHKEQDGIPLLLWCNSTLGLILFWWQSTRQQLGRASLKITAVLNLRVLDTRKLSKSQLDKCSMILNSLKDRDFLPANEAYRDETRKDLDRQLLFGIKSVLQLDPSLEEGLDLLRNQWCAEPSVHGGKSTRIGAS